MLVGAAAAVGLVAAEGMAGPAAAAARLIVAEPRRGRSASCDGGGTAAAADIGMTLGIVMSVKSGAGPASTESMGTVTRLGIVVAVALLLASFCFVIVMSWFESTVQLAVFDRFSP